nr:unnamed protein product [Callosobruchus chinensis]
MHNCLIYLQTLCAFFVLHYAHALSHLPKSAKCPETKYHDWDYLVFSQRWPITSCLLWEEKKEGNTCNMPAAETTWNVHGIWPTKIGKEGPFCCPSAIHFDPTQLQPLLSDLNNNWTNIEEGTKEYSFWRHEWDKHGTCASTSPFLNSILNYFQKGLEWNKQYKLSDILSQNKIIAGSAGYTPSQIFDAVKSVVKVNPMVQCEVHHKTKESMISEIRICFNKSLEPIDCDPSNPVGGNIITNCDSSKPVMYFSELPTNDMSYEVDYIDDGFRQHFEEQMYYLQVYKFLKFLIWFTT